MRGIAWVIAASLVAPQLAHATQDDYQDITWVADWSDAGMIVVERVTYSPEAEGKDLRTWWSIRTPDGVEQAKIHEPYSKKPRLVRPKASTIDQAKLDAVVAGLATANGAKPRPKKTAIRGDVATALGVIGLAATKTCPVKFKFGKKKLTVSVGDVSADGGSSVFPSKDIEANWGRSGPSQGAPNMKPSCYAYGNGLLVRFKLHASYEGDNYEDRIVHLPNATLP